MTFVAENCPDYLIGSLFFVATWLILYWRMPASRKTMLWASITLLPFGPVLESLYVIDYWRPEHLAYWQFFGWLRVSIEDLIFTFTCVGICAAFFDFVHRRHFQREIIDVTWQSYSRLFSAGAICIGIILAVWFWGRGAEVRWLHSVNAHVIGCLIAFPIVIVREGWRVAGHLAAGVGAIYMVAFYAGYYVLIFPDIFERWWLLKNLSGIRFLTIPIEEIYWMAATAMFIGPMVRFCLDLTPEKEWRVPHEFRHWRQQRAAKKKR